MTLKTDSSILTTDSTKVFSSVSNLHIMYLSVFETKWHFTQKHYTLFTRKYLLWYDGRHVVKYKRTSFLVGVKKNDRLEIINIHSRSSQKKSNISHEIKAKARREKQILPSTQEGAALVVPATCPGKQEHLTVWERSSILFLLQQRCAAMTSQVPALTCTAETKQGHKAIKTGQLFKPWLLQALKSAILYLRSPLVLGSKKK